MSYVPRLRVKYEKEVVPKLMEQFGYKSPMEIPKLVKITINQGLGDATSDKKVVDIALNELSLITGQQAVPTIARKSVSNFKLREGMKIGARVTLRKVNMWEFLDRIVTVALPRVRDFRGINDKSFDGRGNYSFGIKEQIIFPEINMDKVTKIMGLGITFVTTAKTDAEALALLKALGMPFKNQNKEQQAN
jgi:large subunit ribosomal protein L5